MSVLRLWPAEKAFLLNVFQANERDPEAREEQRETRDTRNGGMHLPYRACLEFLARFALTLARLKNGLNST